MEMKVNAKRIRAEREKRAWSQERMAAVCGLGVRTIQRIEASGLASYESAQAIAAVLELSVAELSAQRTWSALANQKILRSASAVAGSAVLAVSLFFGTQALAKDVTLDLGMELNGQQRTGRLVTPEGEAAEIRMNDTIKVVLLPKVLADGGVLLTVKIFEANGDDYVLVSEPKVATQNNKEAAIEIKSDAGNHFRVHITPTIR